MDIKGTASKIVGCSGSNPCTASIGNTCSAASSDKGGVVCSLPACPTLYTADASEVEGTGGWNVWSESCLFIEVNYNQYTRKDKYHVWKTVKIKKSSSMLGELVIDRGATSGDHSRHFWVQGTLELEDVTLKGGHAVRSFCSCILIFIL